MWLLRPEGQQIHNQICLVLFKSDSIIKSYYSVKKNVEVWTFPQRFKQRALCQLESKNGIDHAVLFKKKLTVFVKVFMLIKEGG